jgi:hypothetical protein
MGLTTPASLHAIPSLYLPRTLNTRAQSAGSLASLVALVAVSVGSARDNGVSAEKVAFSEII